ncbi:MAG: ABC transporter permease [Lachnospiraceae bacterium]|nr:ABC transporter permease [Lachnospiraceae bacterium]
MMRNTTAIFQKQIKDTLKNKEILIQFIMFPVMAVIMEKSIKIEDMPAHFFADMFSAMYVGMAPLVSIAAVIAEEKEKNTLRVLMMSGVKPWEYLLAMGCYIWLFCLAGALVLGIAGGHEGREMIIFLLIMAAGILASLLIGAAIGTASRSQMMATSITVPVMLVFSFLPMLAEFNDTISNVARIAYSRQIGLLIGKAGDFCVSFENIFVICANMLAALLLFGCAYKKSGLA